MRVQVAGGHDQFEVCVRRAKQRGLDASVFAQHLQLPEQ
jgi:hypothetical protein